MQYAHSNKLQPRVKGTLALGDLTKEHLHSLLKQHGNKFMVLAGISVVSKKDTFVKKVGREIAEKRLAPTICDFTSLQIIGTKHFYNFSFKTKLGLKTYEVFFRLTTVAESDKVKLIFTHIDHE